MTDLNLDELERREKAMTPMPWCVREDGYAVLAKDSYVAECDNRSARGYGPDRSKANAAGIVALRNAFPALLVRVRKLEAECADTITFQELEILLQPEWGAAVGAVVEMKPKFAAAIRAAFEAEREGRNSLWRWGHCGNCSWPHDDERPLYPVRRTVSGHWEHYDGDRTLATCGATFQREFAYMEQRVKELEAERRGTVRLTVEQARELEWSDVDLNRWHDGSR